MFYSQVILLEIKLKKTKEKICDINNEKGIPSWLIVNPFQEFKIFYEISNKKLLRFNQYLQQSNIRDLL